MASGHLRHLVAGNWKMNGLKASTDVLDAVIKGHDAVLAARADLMVCPPATLLAAFAARAGGSTVAVGAQDCHAAAAGAFTGDIAAEMIADAGGKAVIVGHSERRTLHGESDADVRAKAEAAWRAGLFPIVCVGETRAERDAGHALAIVARQIAGSLPDSLPGDLVVAYEPVWAIGTGLTPTVADVAEMHGAIRRQLVERYGGAGQAVRLLYGGSVKPSNAAELMAIADVNGALVGGASLVADDFLAIAKACGTS
ncbi:triose-phosphate isomerase [Chelatococcus asaccharovorans]|uniref:Triosephosphate isomerase n=1 Tax=Chelatococcus asaccharovorans TaxID=28210 RepID=A0A2V3UCX9_9HYPH|nr:triose-phosphate isomerase [Chelatococcus asaccharovorans]MBS7703480.1 triose-phosphate isomerase [Chelatococcus asaccharovorans]PXW61822.1 triosephosphate isomerase [Chelatococcus asaccharovorans]